VGYWGFTLVRQLQTSAISPSTQASRSQLCTCNSICWSSQRLVSLGWTSWISTCVNQWVVQLGVLVLRCFCSFFGRYLGLSKDSETTYTGIPCTTIGWWFGGQNWFCKRGTYTARLFLTFQSFLAPSISRLFQHDPTRMFNGSRNDYCHKELDASATKQKQKYHQTSLVLY